MGRVPEVICIDLDGNSEGHRKRDLCLWTGLDSPGPCPRRQHVGKLEKYVPLLRRFIATTQARPFDRVYSIGWFGDEGRYGFIAREFGIKGIRLAGFEFKDSAVNPIKKKS
jgi:uncharacterized Rossmann fold enzyme